MAGAGGASTASAGAGASAGGIPSPDGPLGGGCFAVGAGLTAGTGGAGLAGAGGAGASSAGETSSVIGPPGSLNSHSNAV